MAAQQAEKRDATEAQSENIQEMDVEERTVAMDDVSPEEIQVEVPEEEKAELEKWAESYAAEVEEAVYEKRKQRAAGGSQFEAGSSYK